jgi:hypothetical protein
MVATDILGGACLSPDSMPRRALRGVTGPWRSRVGVVVALVGIQLGRPAGRQPQAPQPKWMAETARTNGISTGCRGCWPR